MSLEALEVLGHATFGVLAGFLLVYVYAEIHHASDDNIKRVRWLGTVGIVSAFVGIWLGLAYYLFRYRGDTDKGYIKAGDWWWAHSFFMETKEHILILGIFLMIMALIALWMTEPQNNVKARRYLEWVFGTLFLGVLFLEGWGAIIAFGLRVGLYQYAPPL